MAVADGQLLRGVLRDALRGVRQAGVGQTMLHEHVDELLGIDDLGVDDHGHALAVAQAFHERNELRVAHLVGDLRVTQEAAVHGKAGVQRVQAGRDLHGIGLVHGLAIREDHAALLERRAPVGEAILHHEIVHLLGVRKTGEVHRAIRDKREVAPALVRKRLGNALGGVGGDAVDHGPGEAHATLVAHIVDEALPNMASLEPALRRGKDGVAEAAAVLREVIGRNEGNRSSAGIIACKQERRDDAHGTRRRRRTVRDLVGNVAEELARSVLEGITLLRDREGGKLQLIALEVGLDLLIVLWALGVAEERCRGARKDALVEHAILMHDDLQDVLIVRRVDLIDGEGAERLDHHEAAIELASIHDILGDLGMEGAVEVTAAEMDPARLLQAGLVGGVDVECGELHPHIRKFITGLLPLLQ